MGLAGGFSPKMKRADASVQLQRIPMPDLDKTWGHSSKLTSSAHHAYYTMLPVLRRSTFIGGIPLDYPMHSRGASSIRP